MGGGGCGIIGSIRRVAERPRDGVRVGSIWIVAPGGTYPSQIWRELHVAGVVMAADAASEFVMWGVEADM